MVFAICMALLALGCVVACELLYAYCIGIFDKKPKTWRDRLAEEGDPYHCSWSHGDGGSDTL